MRKYRRAAAAALCAVMLAALFAGCSIKRPSDTENTGLVNVRNEMYEASYWTAKYGARNREILTQEEIVKFNAQTIASIIGMEDITYYSTSLGGVQLGVYLKEYQMPEGDLYDLAGELVYKEPETTVDDDGNEVRGEETSSYKADILANRAADDVPSTNRVSYALALGNTSLRRFPTEDSAFASPDEHTQDLFRVRSILIGEPMVVLYKSADEAWYFVQTRTCRGWIRVGDVVVTEKSEWLNYIRAEKFLVITDSAVTLPARGFGEEPMTFYMGTMLPIYEPPAGSAAANTQLTVGNYVVLLPQVDPFGNYTTSRFLVPMNANISVGYLAYTPENVLEVAFRLAGQTLHAGGYGGGWDADSFITSVFACFGIYLPFDSETQRQAAADDIDLSLSATKDITEALDAAAPGTLLFTDTGAAFYLGRENGHYYALHSAQSFFIDETRYTANSILITDMDIVFDNGSTYLNSIRLVKRLALVERES